MIVRAGKSQNYWDRAPKRLIRGELSGLRPSQRRLGFRAWWVELCLGQWYAGIYR